MISMHEAIQRDRVWYCLECGKCSSVCPVTRWESRAYTSPRLLIEKACQGNIDAVLEDFLFWSCLTCERCTELCPSDVHFSEFMCDMRGLANKQERSGECTHSEMMQTIGRMMADPGLAQNRLAWMGDKFESSADSDTLFFVGCMPYYDPIFQKYEVQGIEIAQAALKILNHIGIKPQLLAGERCCGHDQLWQGDIESFQALARLNMAALKDSGAKRIVTTCPECARTLKIDYPRYAGEHGLEVKHLTEMIAESDLNLSKNPKSGMRVTYQDPCRLGRHLGIYDAPRRAIASLGFELVEMRRHAESSLCCGTTCWSNCGQVSKNIQDERLEEARATGADLLITACQKCQIHFKCAQLDPLLQDHESMPIRDLTTLIADMLCQQPEQPEKQEVIVGD